MLLAHGQGGGILTAITRCQRLQKFLGNGALQGVQLMRGNRCVHGLGESPGGQKNTTAEPPGRPRSTLLCGGWLGGMRTVGVLGKHGLDAMDFVVAAAGVMGHGSTGTAEGES